MNYSALSNKRKALLWLAVAVLVIYGRTLLFGFTNWDDDVNIYHNHYYQPVTVQSIVTLWTSGFEHFYTPLTYTVWALLAAISPHASPVPPVPTEAPSPFLFHLINLLLHIASGYLVYGLIDAILKKRGIKGEKTRFTASVAGALFFLLHPMQAEPVSWASGMRDTLSGFLMLVCLTGYLAFAKTNEKRAYQLATAFFVLSLLAKPSSVVLPLLCATLAFALYERRLKSLVTDFIPWIAIALPYVLVTHSVQENAIGVNSPYLVRPFVALDSITFYLVKLVWPFSLVSNYGRTPMRVLSEGWIPLTAIPPVFLACSIRRWPAEARWLGALCFALFVIPLLPVSGLLPFITQNETTVADRYLYLSLIGPAIAIAWAVAKLPEGALRACIPALLALLAARTLDQSGTWRDSVALHTHQAIAHPETNAGERGLALYYKQAGDIEQARVHFQKALEINPNDTWSADHVRELAPEKMEAEKEIELGGQFVQSKDYDAALTHFEEALRKDPRNPAALTNIGNIHAMRGELDDAIKSFSDAIDADPRVSAPYRNLANAYHIKGDDAKARELAGKAQALEGLPQ